MPGSAGRLPIVPRIGSERTLRSRFTLVGDVELEMNTARALVAVGKITAFDELGDSRVRTPRENRRTRAYLLTVRRILSRKPRRSNRRPVNDPLAGTPVADLPGAVIFAVAFPSFGTPPNVNADLNVNLL